MLGLPLPDWVGAGGTVAVPRRQQAGRGDPKGVGATRGHIVNPEMYMLNVRLRF